MLLALVLGLLFCQGIAALDRPAGVPAGKHCVLSSTLLNGRQDSFPFTLHYDVQKGQYDQLVIGAKPFFCLCDVVRTESGFVYNTAKFAVVQGDTSIHFDFQYTLESLTYHLEPSKINGIGLKTWTLTCGARKMKISFAAALLGIASFVHASAHELNGAILPVGDHTCELKTKTFHDTAPTVTFKLVAAYNAKAKAYQYTQIQYNGKMYKCVTTPKTEWDPVLYTSNCPVLAGKTYIPITLGYTADELVYSLGMTSIEGQGLKSSSLVCDGVSILLR
ncbi:uncharacterized protein L969DRAFT_49866 [Mixia osmundae IAM 14324]|uniref:Uncharacterized protein n=1 Tax=Mixia osmundae (strain CBS 9802 / IAM 14324 / JCM 22182 / KY 12970) TaxID=764103 RepID=G7E117_MIXOS|nr:uncharacterized protein L969DRAFT_49866 [Mixia osmundae IAM 14324]KEI38837.1 hypothetical protein L969DRAFT_49866 [Mixia osmundae IAM 14324]GAA96527.1 hypothetical protein E5Q_03195 [Mixia osmundae IAM 14324]